jgi:NAD(P)H-dependent FMN reductase
MERSQALVLVVPEYNHSFPGELKLLLDSLLNEYKGKSVAIVGVSAGMLGGARVIDHIKPVLIELNLHPIKGSVNFMKVGEAFAEDGSLVNEKNGEYIQKMVVEVAELSRALEPLRIPKDN